ncbi:hypothetical protein J2R71_007098 [Bradyrhizobium japonicum]|uniref:hypothetical protein n=1 Tax=Bradyrhizobium japonicum TaxID=375 RepID=UPI0020A0BFF6|nr:hypothetical protein [Bradyrhizobium japonicum]MCP1883942.1 hypothetical protein [Bradyrhizobium japonicum]
MVNPHYAAFVRSLADSATFLAVIAASDDQIEKQRHMEYVSRFLVHTYVEYDGKLDVEEFIDEGVVQLATANEVQQAGATFHATFNLLNQAYGDNALRRFQNGVPTGRVGLAAFESIAVGVAKNLPHIQAKPNPSGYIQQRIIDFWNAPQIQNFFAAGLRGTIRIQRTIPFGTGWFAT